MKVSKQFAVFCQDYILVKDENGPGDVKQRAVGPVGCFIPRFPTRAEARKFLNETILPDARAEGYQSEYWVGRADSGAVPGIADSPRGPKLPGVGVAQPLTAETNPTAPESAPPIDNATDTGNLGAGPVLLRPQLKP